MQTNIIVDDLQEFVEEFDDGKVQFGFARVSDPNSNLPKFVLIGWAGEGVPERAKGYFNGNFATIAKYFHGYHVQITARSQDDLSVDAILSKVESASGAKYSGGINSTAVRTRPTYSVSTSGANEDDWGDDAPPVVESSVTKVQSSYRPTKVDISAIRSSAPSPSAHSLTPAEPVKGSYQPVGKVDIAALRAQGDDRFNAKPGPLQSSYKPIGKVDIAAIKAQAGNKPSTYSSVPKVSSEPEPTGVHADGESQPASVQDRLKSFDNVSSKHSGSNEDEDDAPKSLKDRMKSYQNNAEPLTSLPKPKPKNTVANRFGAASSGGTVPPLPQQSFGPKSSRVGGASRDFGSSGGKTPAQLWAEKHSNKAGSVGNPTASSISSVGLSADRETGEDYVFVDKNQVSVGNITSTLASTSFSNPDADDSNDNEEEVIEEEDSANNISDLKSKFAQNFAGKNSSSPTPEVESTPKEVESAPALPERALPPPPPERPSSPPTHTSSESVVPPLPDRTTDVPSFDSASLPTVERSLPPPLPTAGRSLPPPFVPSTATEPEPEPETSTASTPAPAPPALPAREPSPPVANEPAEQDPVPVGDEDLPMNALVICQYAKDDDNEIGLEEGEQITVFEKPDAVWWFGSNAQGEKGLFPAEYVQLLKPPYAIASYPYNATESNELSFPEGAIITDIEFDDEDWWSGVYFNQRNLFPSNYVELQE